MKILHLYKDYFPVLGGIENHIRVLAEAQAAAGHQVTVLVCDPGPRTRTETRNGVRVIKAGRLTTLASMPISLSQPLWVARLRPDIAHVHSPYPLGELANWLLGRARRTVITYHSDVVRQKRILRFYAPFLRRVLAAADRIIATSPHYIRTSPFLSRVADRCTVIPLGVDVERFARVSEGAGAALRARIGLDDPAPPPLLLFVGRLRYYKGLDDLLRALPRVPDAHLLVVGDGPMRAEWETLARELGLADRVHFLGDLPDADLPASYAVADLFVLPANARAEAFGTVLLEAMAAGLPLICTEVGSGTSFVNRHGETGLVVPPRDPAALAAAINALLADPARRRAMGEAAQRRVREQFTVEQMIARVEALYHQLLNRQGFSTL